MSAQSTGVIATTSMRHAAKASRVQMLGLSLPRVAETRALVATTPIRRTVLGALRFLDGEGDA